MNAPRSEIRRRAEGSARTFAGLTPLLLGLAVLYGPTLADLSRSLWQTDENFHGAIVLAVVIWLLWRNGPLIVEPVVAQQSRRGWLMLLLGLVLYTVGRSQDILSFEVGSALVVLPGLCLIFFGSRVLTQLRFPIFFLAFMVPLPGVLIDSMTGPLKNWISEIVSQTLYFAGYSIGRSGVVLTIGPYQLLIADACSGLNSMFSLAALGVLYIYLRGHASAWRVSVLCALVVPIAFAANVIRVMVLVLITFYFGDAAGQGFVHGWAGMLLFMSALAFLMIVDWAMDVLAQTAANPTAT